MISTSKYEFSGLPAYSQAQVGLWNWYQRAAPGGSAWEHWVRGAFQELLQAPASRETWLEQTHSLEKRPPERHPIEKTEIRIGRSSDNDVVLSAPAIAGSHVRIFRQQDAYFAEDLGSKLGTFIDRRKLEQGEQQRLGDGDKIVIFPYTLEFRSSVRWVPEGAATQLVSTEATATSWSSFRDSRPAGRVTFPLLVEPSRSTACLEVEETFLNELVRRAVYPIEALQPSGDIADAVAECILLSVLDKASSSLDFPLRLCLGRRGGSPKLDANEWGVEIRFLLSITGKSGAFRLFVPAGVLESLSDAAPSGHEWEPSLTWKFPVVMGHVELSEDDLVRVGPGDVVLFTETPSLALPGQNNWQASLLKDTQWSLKIEEILEKTFTMDEQELGQLPVLLQVVLGDKEFTLAEIKKLGAGAIVELGRGKDEPVRLVANGKLVGEGELVEIEGKLGVRILNWKASS
jgi:flagellar motor switch protein FliN